MDPVDKLNELFNIDAAPNPPILMSLKHEHIIKCLTESALEAEFYKDQKLRRTDGSDLNLSMQTPESWLRDVTNYPSYKEDYGISDPVDWSNNSSVNFAKMNLAQAIKAFGIVNKIKSKQKILNIMR